MKTILLLILIVLCQFLIGFGFLRKFKFLPGTLQTLSLSMLFGLALSTVILFVMEILFIPISLLFYIILNFAVIIALHFRLKESLADLKALWTVRTIRPKIYHLVILGAVLYLAFISIWRCYYTPITPRDTVIGMDLVAKYAVEEQRIASSVFSQDFLRGKLSNQPFYAPFTAFMQIIYRMSGLAFGKIWLSIVFVCLLLFLYARLRETLHPLLAGLFLLISWRWTGFTLVLALGAALQGATQANVKGLSGIVEGLATGACWGAGIGYFAGLILWFALWDRYARWATKRWQMAARPAHKDHNHGEQDEDSNIIIVAISVKDKTIIPIYEVPKGSIQYAPSTSIATDSENLFFIPKYHLGDIWVAELEYK